MKKKTQLFLFDLILSFIILIVVISLLFIYSSSSVENINVFRLNLEIMSGFTTTNINELNDEEVRQMFINRKITNIHNSVAQQVAEFYFYDEPVLAQNLTRIFMGSSFQDNYNVNLSILLDNGTRYDVFNIISPNMPKPIEDSEIASSLDKTVIGFINRTDYFGPYKFTLKIWS